MHAKIRPAPHDSSTPPPAPPSLPGRRRTRSRRAVFLSWLRKTHLYVGLWGAVFGLLFGTTGILMNHRGILKIPVAKESRKTVQLALPAGGPASPQALADWLQTALAFKPARQPMIRTQPARAVQWGAREVEQPERWNIMLATPGAGISAEYFVGNRFVRLERSEATPIGTLMRLHTATGVNAFWVLLSDSIGGSLILLSLTGLLLWTQLHTIRTAAVLTSAGALLAGLWFMWSLS